MSLAGSSAQGGRRGRERLLSLPGWFVDRGKGAAMNADTLETVSGSNGSEADDGSCEDVETRLRDMREIVDEIERNYSLDEISEDDWKIYVEYCAALGQPVSERDLLRKKHPELYPEEIDFMLSPRNDGECPF
jgi:hypothetical protein